MVSDVRDAHHEVRSLSSKRRYGPQRNHSCRNATVGSIRTARAAGNDAAMEVTAGGWLTGRLGAVRACRVDPMITLRLE